MFEAFRDPDYGRGNVLKAAVLVLVPLTIAIVLASLGIDVVTVVLGAASIIFLVVLFARSWPGQVAWGYNYHLGPGIVSLLFLGKRKKK
jgi:hypothetical protein